MADRTLRMRALLRRRTRCAGLEHVLDSLAALRLVDRLVDAQALIGHLQSAGIGRADLDRPLCRANQGNAALSRPGGIGAETVDQIDAAEDQRNDTADADQPAINDRNPAGPAGDIVLVFGIVVVAVDHRISSAGATPNRTRPEAMTVATALTSASRARVSEGSSGRMNRKSGSSRPRFQCA